MLAVRNRTEDDMAKKRSSLTPSPSKTVTPDRAARLYRLLRLLGTGPQTREALMRRLRLDVRGFYRDLEVLREAGIDIQLRDRRYTLENDEAEALSRLPFPDPHLNLGEAVELSKGRTASHRKLKQQINQIVEKR
jgi:predicted DNA-binding transcriptional regulator YafY